MVLVFLLIFVLVGILDLLAEQKAEVLLVFDLLLGSLFLFKLINFTVIISDFVPVVVLSGFDVHGGAASNAAVLRPCAAEGGVSCSVMAVHWLWRKRLTCNQPLADKLGCKSVVFDDSLAHSPVLTCHRKNVVSVGLGVTWLPHEAIDASVDRFSRVGILCDSIVIHAVTAVCVRHHGV